MMLTALVALVSLSSTVLAAGTGNFSSPCLQSNNRLSFGTYQLSSDCESEFYCSDNATCAYKGCRREVFPFGYPASATLPPYCAKGTFCPDEEDQCLPLLAVDSPCQLNRDDQCAPPDDWKTLSGPRNTNGSVCINFTCMYANATLGTACEIENMPYVVYDQVGGKEYVTIMSRDNCANNLYCDGTQKQCLQQKSLAATCVADKECASLNCNTAGKCDNAASAVKHVATWVFIVVGAAILGTMIALMVTLFFFHQKTRKAETEKRAQYWREQEAFRNNILSLREQARASTVSLPRGGEYQDYPESTSSRPMLYSATKSSGLRNNYDNTDADSMEESLVPHGNDDDDYNGRRRNAPRRV